MLFYSSAVQTGPWQGELNLGVGLEERSFTMNEGLAMLHIRDNGYHKHNNTPARLSAQLDLSVIQRLLLEHIMEECSMFVCALMCRQAGVCLCFSSPYHAATLFGIRLINAHLMRSSGHAVCECCLCKICQTN